MNKESLFPFPSQITESNRNEYDEIFNLTQKKLRQTNNKKLKQYEFFNHILTIGLKLEKANLEKK